MNEENIGRILGIIEKSMKSLGPPLSESVHESCRDPFNVLVSTMLSARTKDEVTEAAVRRLFSRADGWQDIGKMKVEEIKKLIRPVNFYKTKARHLKELSTMIGRDFGGIVPDTLDDLTRLPGVGRKTANIVLSISFAKPAIGVDTHVHQILNRLGYVQAKTPEETERVLNKKLPKKYWRNINATLVLFGQNVCVPVSPFCSRCPVSRYCPRIGVKKSR
jgi:endonuclease-3